MKLSQHLLLAWLLRLLLVIYSEWHDVVMHLPYTDIDYEVFTDAARHMSCGESPYKRLTYRYPPVLAALLLPNIWLHKSFGKVLFSTFDIIAGGLGVLMSTSSEAVPTKIILMLCLYNPLNSVVSTRGNADAVSSALVMLSIMSICRKYAVTAGIVLALAAHLRIYPILFILPMWLSLSGKQDGNRDMKFFQGGLRHWSHLVQSLLMEWSCYHFLGAFALSLTVLTSGSYALYGWEFFQESYLYHFTRVDTRHNFSVHFYMLYLGGSVIASILAFIPQFMILIIFGIKYGTRQDVAFACFCQAFVFVALNKVMTAQYFLWPMSVFPAILPKLGGISFPYYHSLDENTLGKTERNREVNYSDNSTSADEDRFGKKSLSIVAFWFFSLGLWLLSAYLLEFLGVNTFMFIWISSLLFFCSNIFILGQLIQAYEHNTNLNSVHLKKLT